MKLEDVVPFRMDADEKELMQFILCHSDNGNILLNTNKLNELLKYYNSVRVRKYTELCNYLNKQPEIFKQYFLKICDGAKCITFEKNYNISPKDKVLFKEEFISEAFTLVPKVNEQWMFDNVNGVM